MSLARGVARRWQVVAAIAAGILLLALLALQILPQRYKAIVQVLVYDPQRPVVASLATDPESARLPDAEALNTEIVIIESEAVARHVADRLQLDRDPAFQRGGLRTALSRLLAGPPSTAQVETQHDTALAEAATILQTNITAERVPLSYVLAISVVARRAELAQRLANTVAQVYLDDQQDAARQSLDQMAELLQGKLAAIDARIAANVAAAEQLKARAGIVDAGKGSLAEQQIANLNAELMTIGADNATKRAQLEQAATAGGGTNGLPDTPLMAQLRQQQSLLIRQIDQLRATLGEHHARVEAARAQLGIVGRAITDETAQEVGALRSSLDVGARRADIVRAQLQELHAQSTGGESSSGLLELQHSIDADTKLRDSYVSQLNDVQTSATLGEHTSRIISPAQLPLHPSFPRAVPLLAISALLGIGVGVLAALLIDMTRGGIRPGPEAERRLGHRIIGVLAVDPQMPQEFGASWGAPGDTNLPSRRKRMEEAAALRIGVRRKPGLAGAQVVMVAAAQPAQGSTSVAMLLAMAGATMGEHVLLIDGDLHTQGLSRRLGLSQSGFAELLSGAARLDADSVLHNVGGVNVLPAGNTAANAFTLTGLKTMGTVLAHYRRQYELIVIDAPPVLSAIDARLLGELADDIVIVVDARRPALGNVRQAIRLLQLDGRTITGIVLNQNSPSIT